MKRLFVRPGQRGGGLGRLLAQRIIGEARQAGYAFMVLDTLRSLQAACDLYRRLGFREIPPYNDIPSAEAAYFRLEL